MPETAYAQEVCYNLRGGSRALLLDAFANVRKEDFLFPPPWHVAITRPGYGRRTVLTEAKDLYQDMLIELVPGAGINTGQPSLWAQIFNWSELKSGMTVFESGSGLGYFTAIISHVVGPDGTVYFDEPHEALHDACQKNLLAFENVRSEYTGGALDRSYLCYGTTTVPAKLYEKTRRGGQIVFPFTDSWGNGFFLSLKKKKTLCELKVGSACSFVTSRTYKRSPYTSEFAGLTSMSFDISLAQESLSGDELDIAQMVHLALSEQSDV